MYILIIQFEKLCGNQTVFVPFNLLSYTKIYHINIDYIRIIIVPQNGQITPFHTFNKITEELMRVFLF